MDWDWKSQDALERVLAVFFMKSHVITTVYILFASINLLNKVFIKEFMKYIQ